MRALRSYKMLTRKTKIAAGLYLICALAFGAWFDAMDRRYGVEPEAQSGWFDTTIAAVGWPLALPLAMASVAAGGWGRWTKFKTI